LKKTKNIFSIVTLLLFLISFWFYSYNGLAGISISFSKSQNQKCFAPNNNSVNGNSTQQLSEKNENETENENNYTTPVFDLNFHSSYFHLQIAPTPNAYPQFLAENSTYPIYISVRNFRV